MRNTLISSEESMSKKKCCNSKKPCKNCPKLKKGERIDFEPVSSVLTFIAIVPIDKKRD